MYVNLSQNYQLPQQQLQQEFTGRIMCVNQLKSYPSLNKTVVTFGPWFVEMSLGTTRQDQIHTNPHAHAYGVNPARQMQLVWAGELN